MQRKTHSSDTPTPPSGPPHRNPAAERLTSSLQHTAIYPSRNSGHTITPTGAWHQIGGDL